MWLNAHESAGLLIEEIVRGALLEKFTNFLSN
jgi:hypothetical protein